MDVGRRELQHPADVCRCDEVPRRAHHVRAENQSPIERTLYMGVGRPIGHPQPERPFRGLVFLRLHRAEP